MTDNFVFQNMLTCIGNKRKLVKNIHEIVSEVASILDKKKLNIVDGFSGSSVVSRQLVDIADNLYTNDLELYAFLMAQCYLVTPKKSHRKQVKMHIDKMNGISKGDVFHEGIITKLYAPRDTHDIKEGERCFYTHENALIIDTLRKYISENVEEKLQPYCLVPLLNKASIHVNTAGVFKGFYKNGAVGCFGGKGEVALNRIMKPIELDVPIWSEHKFKSHCSNEDINTMCQKLPGNIDLVYFDPPYNQHPYGSNYFMLNVIARNEEPCDISKVSGIPKNWNKSKYNARNEAMDFMKELLTTTITKTKYILISYNNEGIITPDNWIKLLEPYEFKKYEINYDTYKGSRNLKNRSNKVIETMYLIQPKTV